MSITWYLVADPQHAQIWTRQNRGAVQVIGTMSPMPKPKAGSEPRTRSNDDSSRIERRQSAPIDDVASHDSLAPFVERLLAVLQRASEEEAFDELVLIAPSRMLATLLSNLPSPLSRRIVTSFAKDLVKQPPEFIRSQIAALPIPAR